MDNRVKKLYNNPKGTKMIEIRNLRFTVQENGSEKDILKDLNVTFPKEKITCITGHNGSGKSTLIKLIAGILKQSDGDIFCGNKKIDHLSIDERAKLGITLAFQQPVRFKGLTVKDLISLAIKTKEPDKEINLGEVCKFLSIVGLCAKDYINREIDDTLSGGELKRIELAIAIAKGGEVFLFDEPEAGIDLWSFDSLVEIFENLKGKTVIIVSHQKKILDMADYILLLNDDKAVFGKRGEIEVSLARPQCARLGGQKYE